MYQALEKATRVFVIELWQSEHGYVGKSAKKTKWQHQQLGENRMSEGLTWTSKSSKAAFLARSREKRRDSRSRSWQSHEESCKEAPENPAQVPQQAQTSPAASEARKPILKKHQQSTQANSRIRKYCEMFTTITYWTGIHLLWWSSDYNVENADAKLRLQSEMIVLTQI